MMLYAVLDKINLKKTSVTSFLPNLFKITKFRSTTENNKETYYTDCAIIIIYISKILSGKPHVK